MDTYIQTHRCKWTHTHTYTKDNYLKACIIPCSFIGLNDKQILSSNPLSVHSYKTHINRPYSLFHTHKLSWWISCLNILQSWVPPTLTCCHQTQCHKKSLYKKQCCHNDIIIINIKYLFIKISFSTRI